MLRLDLLPLCAACGIVLSANFPAAAATLRPFRILPGATVRLSDLFADLATADRILGAAPAPGARILVQAPQLAAIARDYSVDWRPVTGAEQSILERDSQAFSQTALMQLLRAKLDDAGAPAEASVSLPGYAAPMLPAGAAIHAELTDFSYDPANFRFTATLTIAEPDAEPAIEKIAGQIMPTVEAVMLTHRLRSGSVLTEDDLRAAKLPATALHGDIALSRQAALGLALRRDTPPGQPLVIGDLIHPNLVARNATVRMALNAGAISLAAAGIAMEDGALGAHIRVQNPTSHAVMLAEVTGADEVRIMPGHGPFVVAAQ